MARVTDEKTTHFVTLDAVRGIAAIAVMLHHIANAQHLAFARYGYLAVDLFFMLSGFVIGRAYEARLRDGLGWGAFMRIRLLRLYPVIAIGIVLGATSALLGASGDGPASWGMLLGIVLIPDLAGGNVFPISGVLWSLFFELVANGVHAAGVRRLTNRVLMVVLIVSAPLALLLAWHFGSFNLGYMRAHFVGGFVRVAWGYGVGLLLYRLVSNGIVPLPRFRIGWLIPVALAALALLLPKLGSGPVRIFLPVFVGFPAILYLSLAGGVTVRLHGIARWLGGISFPLYAINHPLIEIAAWGWGSQLGWWRWTLLAVAILGLATLIEYGFDAPLRRRLRRSPLWPDRSSAPVS